jgi:hypothetical protein
MKGVIKSNSLPRMTEASHHVIDVISNFHPKHKAEERAIDSTKRLLVESPGETSSNFRDYKLLSIFIVAILSLLLNFVMLLRPTTTKHICDYDYLTNINWENELKINSNGPRFKKFLKGYFLLTENKLTLNSTSKNLPNNLKCLETHSMIITNYFKVIKKRKEVKNVLVKLDLMEKHLFWGGKRTYSYL